MCIACCSLCVMRYVLCVAIGRWLFVCRVLFDLLLCGCFSWSSVVVCCLLLVVFRLLCEVWRALFAGLGVNGCVCCLLFVVCLLLLVVVCCFGVWSWLFVCLCVLSVELFFGLSFVACCRCF